MPSLSPNLELERCPHCRVHRPVLSQLWSAQTTNHKGHAVAFWSSYKCGTCGKVLLAQAHDQGREITAYYPNEGELFLAPAIPSRAQAYLRQAADTLHSPSASVVVSASAVDAMLKAKGLREGALYARIAKAAADHLITAEMAAWAHDIRLDANDERHADEGAALPDQTDAQRCLDFALALAQFMFVLPEQVRRGREAAAKT